MSNFLAVTKDYYESTILPREKAKTEDPKAFFFMGEPAKEEYKVVNNNGVSEAIIPISGSLSNDRYYGSSYLDIIEMVKDADKDPDVDLIVLETNSPGGEVDGVEAAANVIRDCEKEVVARVGYMACSGAMWLISQADRIEATSKIAVFGSIGVIVSYYDFKEYFEKEGIKQITITSTDAPDKALDPATEKGKTKLLEWLDTIHSVFVEYVSKGRNTTEEDVNNNYGKGGVLVAEDALRVGMIDTITISEEKTMAKTYTEEEFNSAVKSAEAKGKDDEKARVSSHLKYLGKAKDETVTENIKEGKTVAECADQYIEEATAKNLLDNQIKASEDPDLKTGDGKVEDKTEEGEDKPVSKEVMDSVMADYGITK